MLVWLLAFWNCFQVTKLGFACVTPKKFKCCLGHVVGELEAKPEVPTLLLILFITALNSIHHLDTHFHPQTLIGPLSAVSRPIAAIKYSFESAWRDLLESVGALKMIERKHGTCMKKKRQSVLVIYNFHMLLLSSDLHSLHKFSICCQKFAANFIKKLMTKFINSSLVVMTN